MSEYVVRPHQRNPSHGSVEQRHALRLVKPFAGRFAEWNQKAAQATAGMLSSASSLKDQERYRESLGKLLIEVETAYEEFEAAVAGEPPHSRIEDIRHAFDRLRQMLRRG